MTLVKFKKPRLPRYDSMFTDLLGSDRLLTNDFMLEDKWIPAMNVKETEDHFEIEMAAPGFNKKDFEISIENGLLKISAENSEEIKEEEKDYTRKEFNYNSFLRSFTLPENVNEEEMIDATYKRGILKLVLNKVHIDEITPKRVIEVH
ncbi:Hsp20/alpha crystallin family protein [Lutimonas halocynthiae]|uniref:Hsp20/alpha crystallin family protein n=1 Tax=Lutimonas halocynthiae TaxID=1446477 RepID=UPI0025B30727|nr:Hsp20/alpha crystallin family protein [Lutimonas halocynthiae]MDN3641202.1 Hsp20/alpha crystallin family protein [Lutimonas halocynthiae]